MVPADGGRRAEILAAAGDLFATAGIRATVKDVADACGIQPSTLYHHFESKDAILDALVDRFHFELGDVAARAESDDSPSAPADSVIALALDIAALAARHRAALILDVYRRDDGPGGDGPHEPVPATLRSAMVRRLEAVRAAGMLRDAVGSELMAEELCTAMLHVALGPVSEAPLHREIALSRCRVLLHGVAVERPTSAELDESEAMGVCQRIVAEWQQVDADLDPFVAMVRTVAQVEFARRGYGATTMRDIAAAAGLSSASMIYRRFPTKDDLLASITGSFLERVSEVWAAVLGSSSGAVEKLDALIWADINLVTLFGGEANALMAWLRESPAATGVELWGYTTRLQQLEALVAEGASAGQLDLRAERPELRGGALAEVVWLEENVIRLAGGARAALELARDTTLRGAMTERADRAVLSS